MVLLTLTVNLSRSRRRRFDEAQGVELKAAPASKAKGLKPTTSSGRAPPLSLAWSGLPLMYPTIMRDDELPEEFNKHISSLFQRPQRLVEGFGSLGSAVSFLGLQVFAAIPQDGKRIHLIELGKANDWLATINYKNCRRKLNASVLRKAAVWDNFLQGINFCNAKSKAWVHKAEAEAKRTTKPKESAAKETAAEIGSKLLRYSMEIQSRTGYYSLAV
ncbi:hypothetical protein C8R47DRAFT_1200196 [Mycena vitilis]|nr:hypothetical protein C8R47DRAFT_1200196 [Mycena vitilis]